MIYFVDQSLYKFAIMNSDKYFIRVFMSTVNPANIYPIHNGLIPTDIVQNYYISGDMESFRKSYMEYLNTYDGRLGIMDIMMDSYYNPDVIIITDLQNDLVMNIIECIISYIFNRYGYRCTIAYDADDVLHTDTIHDSISPSCYGVFYADKDWYIHETMDPNKILSYLDEIEEFSNG